MKLTFFRVLALASAFIIQSSCTTARIESGKAIYCPGVQLERVTPELSIDDKDWQTPTGENTYADLTNLLNGKRIKAQVLMRKVTNTGTVIISIDKKTAEALGMVYTGLAPVEIKYKRTL